MMTDPEESSPMAVGERLRLTRESIGLTQTDFAARAGLNPTTYNQYEKGRQYPQIRNAIALREAYDLTLDWIFCGDPSGLRYEMATAIKALQTAREAGS